MKEIIARTEVSTSVLPSHPSPSIVFGGRSGRVSFLKGRNSEDKAPKQKNFSSKTVGQIRLIFALIFSNAKNRTHPKHQGHFFLNEPTIEKETPGFPHKLQETVNLRIARHETVQWLADKGETSSSWIDVIRRQILAPIKVIFKGVHHLQDGVFGTQKNTNYEWGG